MILDGQKALSLGHGVEAWLPSPLDPPLEGKGGG